MDPKKTKKNSCIHKNDSENNNEPIPTAENTEDNKNNSDGRKLKEKSKKKWDDREIDFDQLIF